MYTQKDLKIRIIQVISNDDNDSEVRVIKLLDHTFATHEAADEFIGTSISSFLNNTTSEDEYYTFLGLKVLRQEVKDFRGDLRASIKYEVIPTIEVRINDTYHYVFTQEDVNNIITSSVIELVNNRLPLYTLTVNGDSLTRLSYTKDYKLGFKTAYKIVFSNAFDVKWYYNSLEILQKSVYTKALSVVKDKLDVALQCCD